MADNKSRNISNIPVAIPDVPDAPTVSATNVGTSRAYNNGAATVSISSPTGGLPTSYSITTTPSTTTTAGVSGANTITGLASATSYTVSVTATNSAATSGATTTGAFTATTVPQAPTIGTFTDGGTGTTGTLSFTAGATGGSSITAYKYSTNGINYTTASGTTSPLSLTGLTTGTYTFTLQAVNANGDSAASSGVSGTVIPPDAFESIATATLTGGTSASFTSIPSSYQHLQIRVNAKTAISGADIIMKFNNDTGNNYAFHYLRGDGASASASGAFSDGYVYITPTNGTYYATAIIDIHDYASTSKHKTSKIFSGYDSNGSGWNALRSGLWMSTSAINRIDFTIGGTTFSTGTTFALYGIKGA